jgi:hypothetical protein
MKVRHLPAPAPQTGGGRVELRRAEGTGFSGEASYECRWFYAGSVSVGALRVVVEPKPEVIFDELPKSVPPFLVSFTVTLLRTVARSSGAKGFPRRLTRWRAEPGAACDPEE